MAGRGRPAGLHLLTNRWRLMNWRSKLFQQSRPETAYREVAVARPRVLVVSGSPRLICRGGGERRDEAAFAVSLAATPWARRPHLQVSALLAQVLPPALLWVQFGAF